MGQKLWEHPACDYYIQLMKEVDKTGAKVPYRKATDFQESCKMQTLNMRRTRVVQAMAVPGALVELTASTLCGKCGRPTHKKSRRVWRQVYPKSGGRVDIFICGKCRVV